MSGAELVRGQSTFVSFLYDQLINLPDISIEPNDETQAGSGPGVLMAFDWAELREMTTVVHRLTLLQSKVNMRLERYGWFVQNFQVCHGDSENEDMGFSTFNGVLKMTSNTSIRQVQINHRAKSMNSNRGTSGTNKTNAMVHGNRGKQLNPNQGATAIQPPPNAMVKPKHG
nr:hypothetical protein [uncultured Rhodoferax sp.]